MCRLLGVTNFEYSRHEKIVRNFCRLARSGNVMAGDPPGHGDGWGLALYRGGELIVRKSGGNLLDEADKVIEILSGVGRSPVVILHLRKSAWNDTTCTRHAHPFHHNNVVFAHNGVVYGYKGLLPDIRIPGLGEDALDTEVFFYRFMSAQSPDLGQSFLDTVALIKRGYKFSALNCLFSDGARLFAYRDYSKEPEYYSLYKSCSETSGIISSQPLDENLQWEMMAREEFLEIAV
ncbi:MAG: class II glutamine amidotransferase [Geobacteraceae bacterium GWC2_58_44]|nr:MAG: class II glutamine amidotransferase [Geobacteraceae bacterium GWC2_58_44]HBG04260.1 class II glutamine amidotransferase [Geobacter sp.]